MTFILTVAAVVFFFAFRSLQTKVEKLEAEVKALRGVSIVSTVSILAPALLSIPNPPRAVGADISEVTLPARQRLGLTLESASAPLPKPRYKPEPATPFFLVTWFKDHTLIKIGGILFFLGAVWFVSYAISLGWISATLRIAFCFALALLFYALGWYRIRTSITQHVVLTALGTGLMCATAAAAQFIFAMFEPLLVLAFLALAIAYTGYTALWTKVTWLLTLSAGAGLLAPIIMGGFSASVAILLYLVLLVGGLLTASSILNHKVTPLLLALGVVWYELRLLTTTEPNTLWFFVVVLAALFLSGITATLARYPKPHFLDIATFTVMGTCFVYMASLIALSSTLALFVATFVVGTLGYVLTLRQAPPAVVSVYAGFATALLLIATSFLYSGFTLVLAYTFEATAAFLIVTYLGLPKRVVWFAAGLYLLPLFGSLISFGSPAWETGVMHPDGYVLYGVAGALVFTALWLIHNKVVSVYTWSSVFAGIFGTVGFFYLYGVFAVVAEALFYPTEAMVMTYLLWGILSLTVVYYTLRQAFPTVVIIYSSLTLLIPVIASIPSFFSPAWHLFIRHAEGLGVLGLLLIIVLTILLLLQRFNREYNRTLLNVIGGFVAFSVTYLFAFFFVLWNGLLDPALALVAIYMSYTLTLYGLTSLFVLLRAGVSWVLASVSAFTLPLLLALSSISYTGWDSDVASVHAVGLFGLITILTLLGLGLGRRFSAEHREDMMLIQKISRGFFGVAFIYAIALTWTMAHSLLAAGVAVTVTLFMYTVSGLFAYQYGKKFQREDWRYAGVTLLSLVILRLLLVDVWEMQILYRVVTFLGIGALFMGTALLEKNVISDAK